MAKVLRIIETEAIMRNIFFHLLVFAKHLLSKKIVAHKSFKIMDLRNFCVSY